MESGGDRQTCERWSRAGDLQPAFRTECVRDESARRLEPLPARLHCRVAFGMISSIPNDGHAERGIG